MIHIRRGVFLGMLPAVIALLPSSPAVSSALAGTPRTVSATYTAVAHARALSGACDPPKTVTLPIGWATRRVTRLCHTPQQALGTYYAAISARQYRSAYSLLGDRRPLTYPSFVNRYRGVAGVTVTRVIVPSYRVNVPGAPSGTQYTCVGIGVTERFTGGRTARYGGWIMVERQQPDLWKMGWRVVLSARNLVTNGGAAAPSKTACRQASPFR